MADSTTCGIRQPTRDEIDERLLVWNLPVDGRGLSRRRWYFLHRLMIWMEDQGWIYYRQKPNFKTGIKGLLIDVDRLTRPSRSTFLKRKNPNAKWLKIKG